MSDNHATPSLLPTFQAPQGESAELPSQSQLSTLGYVIFKGDRIYRHPLLRLNYTTYDLRRETDSLNLRTDHRDIMLLAHRDGSDGHPFCYARVLAIYHANVIYVGPESKDYQSRRLEFLWVRWFELLDQPSSWEHCTLDKARFIPMTRSDSYGFVDPADVLRCCHVIPSFADGKLHPDGVAMSRNARDAEDWKFYYINRLVSFTIDI